MASGPCRGLYGYLLGATLMIAAGLVEVGEGDLDLEKMKGEDAAPIESEGSGRFERQPGERPAEKTGGES